MKKALILYQEFVKENETTGLNESVSFIASTMASKVYAAKWPIFETTVSQKDP